MACDNMFGQTTFKLSRICAFITVMPNPFMLGLHMCL